MNYRISWKYSNIWLTRVGYVTYCFIDKNSWSSFMNPSGNPKNLLHGDSLVNPHTWVDLSKMFVCLTKLPVGHNGMQSGRSFYHTTRRHLTEYLRRGKLKSHETVFGFPGILSLFSLTCELTVINWHLCNWHWFYCLHCCHHKWHWHDYEADSKWDVPCVTSMER
jgi:hypothetical protein